MLKRLILFAVATLVLGNVCQAAVSDAGIGDYYKKEKALYQDKTIPDKDNVTSETETPTEKKQENGASINVNQILVDQSNILSQEETKAITSKYEGRQLSIKDLYKVVAEINELYKNKSYITAKAVLPPQRIENGIVRIQLIEGRFGEFRVEDNQHTKYNYIKERISLNKGDLVKLDQLQKDIFYFNSTNDVAMRAELKPGKEVGTTDCILRVKEPDEWQVTLFSDNAGSTSSGQYRYGMIITNNSLFGNREALVLNPTWTKGTMAGSVSYTVPIDKLGTRVGISYSQNQSNIISGPYESLDITGNSSDVGLSLTHPLMVEANRKVDGYAELHWKDSKNDFSGVNLIASQAKTATIGTNIRTTDNKGVWYSQYSFTGICADKKDVYNSKKLWRFNALAIRQQALKYNQSLVFRLSGQLADSSKELPSSEQFSLGGMSSVKGFNESDISGDKGFYTGIEYDFPIEHSQKIQGLLFIDHGKVYHALSAQEYLTSTGVGLIINCSQNVFGKIVVGFPLNSSKEHDGSRIHFFLQTNIK